MTTISVVNCFVLLAVLLYYATDSADSLDSPNNEHGRMEMSSLWFGPRMGRKKRNPINNKGYRNEKEQQSMGLLDVLRESPLVVVAVNEANKQHNFIPRLGRELDESPPNWLEDGDGDALASRPGNPFSPRLGRNNYNPFSPRLGRDSDVPLK